jgi:hypothetical protein
MDPVLAGIIIGIIGTVATLASVALAWYSGRKTERSNTLQHRLAAYSTTSEWLRDLRNWASEAIDALSESSYLCGRVDGSQEDCSQTLRACQYRLSAVIDRGRFFLPNQPADVGQGKPTAYRGWRHSALDPLVAAVRVMSGEADVGQFPNRETALVEMRREFVSAIQRILAPDLHNKEIARMIQDGNDARSGDPTLGGLLPDKDSVPTGADGLLRRRLGSPSE